MTDRENTMNVNMGLDFERMYWDMFTDSFYEGRFFVKKFVIVI